LERRFSNHWTLTDKATGATFILFERKNVENLLKAVPGKYKVETAYQYITRINREIKEGKHRV
jgi:predicted SpoU family rRNA methylase